MAVKKMVRMTRKPVKMRLEEGYVLDEDILRRSVHLDKFISLENVDRIVLQKLCPTKMYNSTQYRMLVNMPALMGTQVPRTESG